MIDLHPLLDLMVILAAMVLCAALFTRAGIGPTLGYLTAGLLIGPAGFDIVNESLTTAILGELGVVFLLFMIGLELPVSRIRTIGVKVLSMAVLQVLVTAGTIALLAMHYFALSLPAALAIGAGLALSSTTIVLRQLTDRGQLTSRSGRAVFATLMVQDMLVGPLLVTILALTDDGSQLGFVLALAFLKAVVAVALIMVIGRHVLHWLYRPIAAVQSAELFTALNFLVVIGVGFITHEAGLSLAFGGFLAGVLLADTHYRHQVAADIRPLRGLFLGIFFVTVGMLLDPRVLIETPLLALGLALALMLGKALVMIALALAFRIDWSTSWRAGVLLSQGGEFAFVLWAVAGDADVLADETTRLLIIVVAISMALTPALFLAIDILQKRRPTSSEPVPETEDLGEEIEDHVIVIGAGQVGEQVWRGLTEQKVDVVVIDDHEGNVRRLRRHCDRAFFGDPRQPEILEAVHVEKALAVIVAVDDAKETPLLVGLLRYLFDDLPILARARDEAQGRELVQAGATTVVPEVVDTGRHLVAAMMMGGGALGKAMEIVRESAPR